jgi:tRNA(His) 5'-end guanylyltransferase
MKDSLGDRMKRYEHHATSIRMMPRTPTIVRVDGKAFHTFTKHITSELDPSEADGYGVMLHEVMTNTAQRCCAAIQGAVVAYTQSDEISFVLRDWDNNETQPWFGGQLQKIVSISAALATGHFNFEYKRVFGTSSPYLAFFDSRAFSIPIHEVNNYMVWRQQDAMRNSVQYIGHKLFSHASLQHKNQQDIHDMLLQQKGLDWATIPTWMQRGVCITRGNSRMMTVDDNIPVFADQPSYINNIVNVE